MTIKLFFENIYQESMSPVVAVLGEGMVHRVNGKCVRWIMGVTSFQKKFCRSVRHVTRPCDDF